MSIALHTNVCRVRSLEEALEDLELPCSTHPSVGDQAAVSPAGGNTLAMMNPMFPNKAPPQAAGLDKEKAEGAAIKNPLSPVNGKVAGGGRRGRW